MPIFTPSRVAIVVLTLSLLSFLWTFGISQQFATPSLPLINHDAPGQKGNDPVKTASAQNFDRPYIPPDSAWHTSFKAPNVPKPTPTPSPLPKPAESKVPEMKGAEEEKKAEEGEKGEAKQTATPAPVTTLVTSTLAHFPTTAAVNATVKAPADAPVGSTKFCKDVAGASNVMVIVKTSKAEMQDKLPTHLKTLLSCVPNFVIFSDHAGKIDGFTVHNALDTISNTTKASHNEFEEYEKIQQDPGYKPDGGKTKELDKWKFLPMVYQAHKMKPYSRFYIIIEADTSLSWTNLLQWIDRLDYRIPYYIGAPTFLGDVQFAQRGSGILLSYGALKQYAKIYDERYESEWEKRVGRECCGDMVLATTLVESHVEFYSGFPLLQGETPATLDWTDRHWCAPVVSWHHMTSVEIDQLWSFQRSWTGKNGWSLPHLFRDAFNDFILPYMEESKDAWDNLSRDVKIQRSKKQETEEKKEQIKDGSTKSPRYPNPEQKAEDKHKEGKKKRMLDVDKANANIDNAADSAETCKRLCEVTEDCLQWKFTSSRQQECHLGGVVRLGSKVGKKGSEGGWTSGWMLEKIKKKREGWGNCDEVKWKFNQ